MAFHNSVIQFEMWIHTRRKVCQFATCWWVFEKYTALWVGFQWGSRIIRRECCWCSERNSEGLLGGLQSVDKYPTIHLLQLHSGIPPGILSRIPPGEPSEIDPRVSSKIPPGITSSCEEFLLKFWNTIIFIDYTMSFYWEPSRNRTQDFFQDSSINYFRDFFRNRSRNPSAISCEFPSGVSLVFSRNYFWDSSSKHFRLFSKNSFNIC